MIKPQDFDVYVKRRALALAELSDRPREARGIDFRQSREPWTSAGYHYEYVDVALDPQRRTATLTVKAPESGGAATLDQVLAAGARWWPLQMSRELDDAILSLRINQLELGPGFQNRRRVEERARCRFCVVLESRPLVRARSHRDDAPDLGAH